MFPTILRDITVKRLREPTRINGRRTNLHCIFIGGITGGRRLAALAAYVTRCTLRGTAHHACALTVADALPAHATAQLCAGRRPLLSTPPRWRVCRATAYLRAAMEGSWRIALHPTCIYLHSYRPPLLCCAVYYLPTLAQAFNVLRTHLPL